ncbi:S1 family peptidase [Nocardioides alcanivorans]|uniref:S1 family peptidase n=1 Tax=Nocardioides alcanivorans TaxID=2897352 RepID=UPI001F2C831A|nr:S1 family peptidase [Nocardioides alcanivorans]
MPWASHAEPGGKPPETDISTQAIDASTDVSEWATRHWKEDGYGKVVVDKTKARVRIYWRGRPPRDIAARDGEITDGVTVDVVPSPHSDEDLSVVSRKLLADNRTIVYIHPNDDLSGLVVAVDETATATERARAISEIAARSEVPVTIIKDTPWEDATRWNDSAPWQGGSILNFAGNGCSSAFTAVTPSGAGRLISAAHCATGTGGVVRDGAGERIGTVSRRAPAYDALLIDPDTGTIGKVFGGPWNAGTGHSRYQSWVGGSAAPAEGQRVCTSGAMSGEHCNLLIKKTGVWKKCVGGTVDCQGFISMNASGGVAISGADSGGPVYIKRSDGKVGARGVISQGNKPVICGSTAAPTTCYNKVFSIGIHKIENRFGISVEH